MKYRIENILSNQDISDILELKEHSLLTEFKEQYYNLFNTDYSHVNSHYHEFSMFKKICLDRTIKNHYVLVYREGSYCKIHQDDKKSAKTIVTMLDRSEDLIGGECIFYDGVVPYVCDLQIGESVIYDQNMFHGVSMVQRGFRTVLVSWFL